MHHQLVNRRANLHHYHHHTPLASLHLTPAHNLVEFRAPNQAVSRQVIRRVYRVHSRRANLPLRPQFYLAVNQLDYQLVNPAPLRQVSPRSSHPHNQLFLPLLYLPPNQAIVRQFGQRINQVANQVANQQQVPQGDLRVNQADSLHVSLLGSQQQFHPLNHLLRPPPLLLVNPVLNQPSNLRPNPARNHLLFPVTNLLLNPVDYRRILLAANHRCNLPLFLVRDHQTNLRFSQHRPHQRCPPVSHLLILPRTLHPFHLTSLQCSRQDPHQVIPLVNHLRNLQHYQLFYHLPNRQHHHLLLRQDYQPVNRRLSRLHFQLHSLQDNLLVFRLRCQALYLVVSPLNNLSPTQLLLHLVNQRLSPLQFHQDYLLPSHQLALLDSLRQDQAVNLVLVQVPNHPQLPPLNHHLYHPRNHRFTLPPSQLLTLVVNPLVVQQHNPVFPHRLVLRTNLHVPLRVVRLYCLLLSHHLIQQ